MCKVIGFMFFKKIVPETVVISFPIVTWYGDQKSAYLSLKQIIFTHEK